MYSVTSPVKSIEAVGATFVGNDSVAGPREPLPAETGWKTASAVQLKPSASAVLEQVSLLSPKSPGFVPEKARAPGVRELPVRFSRYTGEVVLVPHILEPKSCEGSGPLRIVCSKAPISVPSPPVALDGFMSNVLGRPR